MIPNENQLNLSLIRVDPSQSTEIQLNSDIYRNTKPTGPALTHLDGFIIRLDPP